MNIRSVVPADFSTIKDFFQRAFDNRKPTNDVIVQCLRRKMPVHFGGMSDPFQPIEKILKLSLKTLSLLKKYDYPTIVSTKSDLLLKQQYLEVLEEMKIAVQITLTTSKNQTARKLEPHAPSVDRRLEVISTLSEMGIWVSCRLQPLIPKVNSQDIELIDKLSDAGCKHVAIEHYKLPTYTNSHRRQMMCKICSYDIEKYYKQRCPIPSGMFFEISSEEKINNLKNIVRGIHKKRMTYGAADNDLHHLGDDICCCGVGKLEGFRNFFKHHNAKAVFDGKNFGKIHYSSIEREWRPTGSIREILNLKSRPKSVNEKRPSSITDFVRIRWNAPFTNNSPTDMFGVFPSNERDENGNVIYRYENTVNF